jgi:MtN3 and saliva related transmembrane protein
LRHASSLFISGSHNFEQGKTGQTRRQTAREELETVAQLFAGFPSPLLDWMRENRTMIVAQSIEVLGAIAGFCTTFAFVPQLIKIQKQGGRDLSYGMLAFYLIGVLLWLAYGAFLHSPSVILTNAATSLLILLAILMKASKKRRPCRAALVPEQLPGRG